MKNIMLLLVIISAAALLQAQEPLTQNQQAVQQTVIKMFEALTNRDSVSLNLYCTRDIRLYEYGRVWTLDSLVSKAIILNTATDFKRVNTVDFISTETRKNTAWATYRLRSAITSNGKQSLLQWLETVILIKDKKKWKIKVLHSSLTSRS